jgi:hypothetical protein
MPEIIFSSTNIPAIIPPPPEPMKILRRQPTPKDTPDRGSGASTPKSIAEREKDYKDARERIFGTRSDVDTSGNSAAKRNVPSPFPQRNPRGPDEGQKGFALRRKSNEPPRSVTDEGYPELPKPHD